MAGSVRKGTNHSTHPPDTGHLGWEEDEEACFLVGSFLSCHSTSARVTRVSRLMVKGEQGESICMSKHVGYTLRKSEAEYCTLGHGDDETL